MRSLEIVAAATLLTASVCAAQEVAPVPRPAVNQLDTSSADEPSPITVPAGTRIPVTLSTPVHTKVAHHGDAVRLQTAFPVTVDTQIAIPAGTYVEGTIDKVVKRSFAQPIGGLQMHFTRLVFSNGYQVEMNAATLQAAAKPTPAPAPEDPASGKDQPPLATGAPYAMSLQQVPTPPTPPALPKLGPSKGAFIGIGLGVIAATAVVGVLFHRHGVDTFFEPGTQFDMVLQDPLSLDPQRIVTTSITP